MTNYIIDYSTRKWSHDEEMCPVHKISRNFSGWSEFFNQNTYQCDACDYDQRKRSVLERRQLGRIGRVKNKKRILEVTTLNGLYKEMYSDNINNLIYKVLT